MNIRPPRLHYQQRNWVGTTSSTGIEGVAALALLADGRIIVAGTRQASGVDLFAIARLNANGSFDTSFDTDGKLTTAFNSYGDLTAIYVQEDGKLLAIGSGDNGVDSDLVMARYNDNGALDTTFDTDGKLFIDPGGSEGAYKAARQEDGRWLILGYSGELYRLERDGAIDSSFGTSGVVTLTSGVTHAGVTWARGNAYVVGYDGSGATYDFAVSAYHAGLSERVYYQQDANHNVTSITDESGAVLERFVYTPYGQRTTLAANFTGTSDAYGVINGFQGGRFSETTQLYNFRRRDYDPVTSLWMTVDPKGYPDGVNRYASFGTSPLRYTDPTGEFIQFFVIGGLIVLLTPENAHAPANEDEAKMGWLLDEMQRLSNAADVITVLTAPVAAGAGGVVAKTIGNRVLSYTVGAGVAGATHYGLSSALSGNLLNDIKSGNWLKNLGWSIALWSLAGPLGKGGSKGAPESATPRTTPLPGAAEPCPTANGSGAKLGSATSSDYRGTFFAENPELKGQVVVHHAVEQQVLTRYPGVLSEAELHSLENLRGIPKEINSDLHLKQIRREWNQFYRETANPTQEELLRKATEIDAKFGTQFRPPVEGGK